LDFIADLWTVRPQVISPFLFLQDVAACALVALPFGSTMVCPAVFVPVPLIMPGVLKVFVAFIA